MSESFRQSNEIYIVRGENHIGKEQNYLHSIYKLSPGKPKDHLNTYLALSSLGAEVGISVLGCLLAHTSKLQIYNNVKAYFDTLQSQIIVAIVG